MLKFQHKTELTHETDLMVDSALVECLRMPSVCSRQHMHPLELRWLAALAFFLCFLYTLLSSGGFTIQAYKGAQKPSPMDLMRAQATRMAEDPAAFKPPKMDIPAMEEKRRSPRSHNLKPRDMNVLTPTGF